MKKSIILCLHLGFWSCFCFLLLMMLGALMEMNPEDTSIEESAGIVFGFGLVPAVLSFYAYYFFLFPNYLVHKKRSLTITYGLSIAAGAGFIGAMTISNLTENVIDYTESCHLIALFVMSFIGLFSGTVALIIKGFITWFQEIKLKEALVQKNHETELALVKAQLDPHFLFNTLNNIDVLILKNAKEASAYLIELSDIMRFMLFDTKSDKIPLFKELEYIEKYIGLQKIRTANDQYVNFKIEGAPANKLIAPMVFIPFIENAFKHTINKKLKDAINISIRINSASIVLTCKNYFDPNRGIQRGNNGLGNELIQKRLALLYPKKHQLTVSKQDNCYSVLLTINTSF